MFSFPLKGYSSFVFGIYVQELIFPIAIISILVVQLYLFTWISQNDVKCLVGNEILDRKII